MPRFRVLMERISVSIADDVMREERAIAEAQNTGKKILLTDDFTIFNLLPI